MRRGDVSGNVLIELALCASLLGGLFAGAFEYGQTMWVYNGLLDAVRDGARLAMRSESCGAALDAEIRATVSRASGRLAVRADQVEVREASGYRTIAIRGYARSIIFGERRFDGSPKLSIPAAGECRP